MACCFARVAQRPARSANGWRAGRLAVRAGLVSNRADVVYPVGLTAAAGGLPGGDRVAAALAGLPGRVGEVILPRVLARFGEVFVLEPLALPCGISLQG